MRVATIDIGTNTVLLLVAELAASGELEAVEERATITRLGEGVDRTRTLSPAAIARTTSCLDEYAEVIRRSGASRIGVIGTSAMRDAGGGEAIRVHVKRVLGVEARTISGDEEARLTFAGAVSGLGLERGKGVTVFDVGGGSTEVVVGELDEGGRPLPPRYAQSFDVGSVRLTERHVRSDPPASNELDAIENDVRKAFAAISVRDGEPIGIAGTMTTLAAVSLGLVPYDGARVHGHRMPVGELQRVVTELAALPLARRRSVPGLEPKRADVIVAGGKLALGLLARVGAGFVRISDRGVRWGLAQTLYLGASTSASKRS